MAISESGNAKDATLTRDVLAAFRYYIGGRRGLLILGIAALAGGLAVNWSWLVAIGAAPIILSTLPCLVMCVFGVCMMCRSDKTQSAAREAADSTASSLGVAKMDRPTAAGSGCCHEQSDETLSPQLRQLQTTDERKDSHA